ncbi:MAG TPA: SIS domain-containing protein [Thermoanaerobaculia bacterium]|nr:SIS domain-containing protein [Thermoanaerobaculia bacterium]
MEGPPSAAAQLAEILDRRTAANAEFFSASAESIARLCHLMAERFARGGRLVALAASPQARSDARHVAVEFVHPVIVGKRALPAIGLAPEAGELARVADLVARPDDMVIAFSDQGFAGTALTSGPSPETGEGSKARSLLPFSPLPLGEGPGVRAVPDWLIVISSLRARGCLTLAFEPLGADQEFLPPTTDPFVRQELIETLYHLLWESVHVFFEHRGLLGGRDARPVHDAGASRFLYPFLDEGEHDLPAVLADVSRSVKMKADEVGALRQRTLSEGAEVLEAAARAVRARLDSGGTLLAFGNGGSATDAMDLVADFRAAPQGWPARRALDLTEDAAILTALANDIGPDVLFSRQIIAYGQKGDVAVALSTSGGSRNIIEALGEARRRGLLTVAFVGYDGGRILAEKLADFVIVTPSQYVPRIQEAQASAYHALRELVEIG